MTLWFSHRGETKTDDNVKKILDPHLANLYHTLCGNPHLYKLFHIAKGSTNKVEPQEYQRFLNITPGYYLENPYIDFLNSAPGVVFRKLSET